MQSRCLAHAPRIALILVWIATTAPLALAGGSSPQAGEQGRYRAQCRRLTRQIDHYENQVLPLAVERGNRKWEDATNAQIERLWHRRADLCPAYGAERTLLRRLADQNRRFKKMLVAAGRATAAFFTGGVVGP
jgi:hypothetical protein